MLNYKGLKAVRERILVPDAQVDRQIDAILQSQMKTVPVTGRPAQEGDEVVLDYAGETAEGYFEGGSADGQTLVLGGSEFTIVGVLEEDEDSLMSVLTSGTMFAYIPATTLIRLVDSVDSALTQFYVSAPVGGTVDKAEAAIDVGDTLVGMHLRPVAVPLRIDARRRHIFDALPLNRAQFRSILRQGTVPHRTNAQNQTHRDAANCP